MASVPAAPSPSRSCVWTRGPKETGPSLSWRAPRIAPPGCPPPVFAGCSPKTPHSCNGLAGCPRYTRAVCLPGGSVARGEGRGHGRTADSRSGLGLTPLRRVVWPNSPILHRVSNLPEKPLSTIDDTTIHLTGSDIPPRLGREALLALVNWLKTRQTSHDQSTRTGDVEASSPGASASPDQQAEPLGHAPGGNSPERGGTLL